MNYSRQLKEADRMLHSLTSTHHNILSIGGDLLGRYEQLCQDRINLAVEESEEKLLRQQTELRQQAVAEAIAQGKAEMETALKEAREERDICVSEKEIAVREEMEKKIEEMVRQEQDRGEVRTRESVEESEECSRRKLIARVEEVRLEEREISNEKLESLKREMEGELEDKLNETLENDEIFLQQKLDELSQEDNIYFEKIRDKDRQQAELDIETVQSEFNSNLILKQSEIDSLLAKINTLKTSLSLKDEQIKKLEIKYENSRIEFRHFVDTMSDIGGGYTVS